MKLLRDWFTDPTNQHFEAGRALWFASVVAAIGYSGWHLQANGVFDIMEFGAGIAALLAAGGWGISTKDRGASEARK